MHIKTDLRERDSYLLTLVLNLAVTLAAAFLLRIYPFGENGLCFSDGDQYFSVYAMLQRAMLSGEDLRYSWGMVLGGNVLPLAAYYGMSPFNLLLILFSGDLVLGVHVIVLLKILISSLFFCVLLNRLDRGHYLAKAFFSLAYAHMGYAAAYIWNSSWLDGVMILPLLVCGLILLVREKKSLLYILSLAYAILSNFYIGFMLCIGSVVFYGAILCYGEEPFLKKLKGSLWRFCLSSLLGGFLAMPVLLGVLCDMPGERKLSLMQILNSTAYLFDYDDFLTMFHTGTMIPERYPDNLPVIFIGIVFTVLLVLYFFNSEISIRKKLTAGAVMAILIFSFHNNAINTIWHGFSKNRWFNYRYSFLLSFVMLLCAYESFVRLKALREKDYLYGGLTLLLLTIFMVNGAELTVTAIYMLYFDGALGIFTLVWCWLRHCRGCRKAWLTGLLCLMVPFNILANDFISIHSGPAPDFGADFSQARADFETDLAAIGDPGFYRMETLPFYSRCPAVLFGYRGVTNYSSSENKDILRTMENLGAASVPRAGIGRYSSDMPATAEALLGIRYLLTEEPLPGRQEYEHEISPSGKHLYRNPRALSLIFPGKQPIAREEGNGFEQMNRMVSSLAGQEVRCFQPLVHELTESQTEPEQAVTLRFRTENELPVYLYVPQNLRKLEIDRDCEPAETRKPEYQKIVYLGTWAPGESIAVTLWPEEGTEEPFDPLQICVSYEDRAVLNKALSEVNRPEIREETSSRLSFTWNLEEGETQMFASTIPLDPAWTVRDNGREMDLREDWAPFLSFTLSGAGEHEITLEYTPAGTGAGMVLALASALGTAVLCFLEFRSGSRKKVHC